MGCQPDQPPADRRIAVVAGTQYGVVSRLQLQGAGITRNAIDKRVAKGRLHVLHRGVYAVGHSSLPQRARWLAAVLACGEGAALSHRAAAELWGLTRESTRTSVDVAVPARSGRADRPGIAIHRSSTLSRTNVTVHVGIPVTTPSRTVLDIAELVPRRTLERILDEGERLGLLERGHLDATVRAGRGRAGVGRLASVRSEHRAGSTWTRSELEERFLALCRAHRLPDPAVNTRLGPFEVDFLWRAERLVVETDGRAAHATHAAFERDRARDARLTAAGYRVVRFSYGQVVREPQVVAALLRALLRQAPTTSTLDPGT